MWKEKQPVTWRIYDKSFSNQDSAPMSLIDTQHAKTFAIRFHKATWTVKKKINIESSMQLRLI